MSKIEIRQAKAFDLLPLFPLTAAPQKAHKNDADVLRIMNRPGWSGTYEQALARYNQEEQAWRDHERDNLWREEARK